MYSDKTKIYTVFEFNIFIAFTYSNGVGSQVLSGLVKTLPRLWSEEVKKVLSIATGTGKRAFSFQSLLNQEVLSLITVCGNVV